MSIKTVPPHSPMFYYHIATATYSADTPRYLRQAFGERHVEKIFESEFLARVPIPVIGLFKWRVQFFRDLDRPGEFIVGFRGTDNLSNAVDDVFDQLSDNDSLFERMGATIDQWLKEVRKKYEKGSYISAFVGHSAGGRLATHVKKDWLVHRITFNGHKCERELAHRPDLVVNLRIDGDPVSGRFLSVPDRYITLPRKSSMLYRGMFRAHKLANFAYSFARFPGSEIDEKWIEQPRPVAELDWHELLAPISKL